MSSIPAWAQLSWMLALLSSCMGAREGRGTSPAPASASLGLVEPVRVEQVLSSAASSTDILVRSRALQTLVQCSPIPGAGPWGPRGIWDPDPWVQSGVVEGLGTRIEEPESRALLQALVERDGVDAAVRCRAARHLGDPAVLPWIQQEYESPARMQCALAGLSLGDPAAREVMGAALQDDEIPLDAEFIRRLGEGLPSDLSPSLEQALEWADEAIVLTLAGAAARLEMQQGWLLLAQALGSEDEILGLEAFDILASLPSSRRADALLQSQRDSDTLAGVGSAMLLELREGKDTLRMRSFESDDRDLRQLSIEMATLALSSGATGRPERTARDLLSLGLVDPEPVVRLASLRGLTLHAAPDQLMALFEMLKRVEAAEELDVAMTIRCRMAALSESGSENLQRGETQ